WHMLRVIAYLLVLGYVSRGYALMVSDLRRTLAQTRRSERRLAAQYEVTQVLADASTLQDAGKSILQAIGESLAWELGILWGVDEQKRLLRVVDLWHVQRLHDTEFVVEDSHGTFAHGIEPAGRVGDDG